MPVLKYESAHDFYEHFVKPIKLFVPDWYKKKDTYLNKKVSLNPPTVTYKACLPFLESMTTGYAICTPVDLLVEQGNGSTFFSWKEIPNVGGIVNRRNPLPNADLPIPGGCSPEQFTWGLQGGIEIPSGYSAVITHPLNRHDLPFVTLSGVVDDVAIGNTNIPFFIKEGFTGVIPQGTPIAQIIPFKREKWSSQMVPGTYKKGLMTLKKSTSILLGWYKSTVWKKKFYE